MKYVYIIGKSCTGKDTIYHIFQKICSEYNYTDIDFSVPITTRPKRDGETDGIDYHFVTEKQFKDDVLNNKYASHHAYNVADNQTWFYANPQIDLSKSVHVKIATLETINEELYNKINTNDEVYIFDIVLPNEILADRIYNRALNQGNTNWKEIIRRTIADAEDYSDVKISSLRMALERDIKKSLFRCVPNTLDPSTATYSIIYTLEEYNVINMVKNIDKNVIFGIN